MVVGRLEGTHYVEKVSGFSPPSLLRGSEVAVAVPYEPIADRGTQNVESNASALAEKGTPCLTVERARLGEGLGRIDVTIHDLREVDEGGEAA